MHTPICEKGIIRAVEYFLDGVRVNSFAMVNGVDTLLPGLFFSFLFKFKCFTPRVKFGMTGPVPVSSGRRLYAARGLPSRADWICDLVEPEVRGLRRGRCRPPSICIHKSKLIIPYIYLRRKKTKFYSQMDCFLDLIRYQSSILFYSILSKAHNT